MTDANFDCSANGFSLQAMDSSHVSLVALLLRADGFDLYRCDKNMSMGMNIANMARRARGAPRRGFAAAGSPKHGAAPSTPRAAAAAPQRAGAACRPAPQPPPQLLLPRDACCSR